MIFEKLKPVVEALPENAKPAADLRMSVAGECQRKLEYQTLLGPKAIDVTSFLRMETGSYLGKMMADLCMMAMPKDFINPERELRLVTPAGTEIIGHQDAEVLSLDATLDFKWVSDSTFQMLKNQNAPLDTNVSQINLYSMANGHKYNLLVYINRETYEFLEFYFEADPLFAASILHKIDMVNENRKAKTLSPRQYTDKSDSPCWYCPYKEECYTGFAQEIEKMAEAVSVSDPQARDLAMTSFNARRQRLAYEKEEENSRTKLGALLHGLGIKQASITPDERGVAFSVDIKAGKKDNLICTVREKA